MIAKLAELKKTYTFNRDLANAHKAKAKKYKYEVKALEYEKPLFVQKVHVLEILVVELKAENSQLFEKSEELEFL